MEALGVVVVVAAVGGGTIGVVEAVGVIEVVVGGRMARVVPAA